MKYSACSPHFRMSFNCIRFRSCASSAKMTDGLRGAVCTSRWHTSIRSVKSSKPFSRLYSVHLFSNSTSVAGQPSRGNISPRYRLRRLSSLSPGFSVSESSSAAASPSSLLCFFAGVMVRAGLSLFHSVTFDSAISGPPSTCQQWECSVPTRSLEMGRSRPASSAAAEREKDVTRTESAP